jgi:transcriptional regulator with XRE-family HTH domain
LSKPPSQDTAKPNVFSICFMRDSQRRARRATLLGKRFRGKQQALAERSGLTKGRIAQLLDANEPFGERAGRSLALRLGLSEDFFEREDDTALSRVEEPGAIYVRDPEEAELVAKWRLLIVEQKETMLSEIDKLVRQNEVAFEHLRKMKLDQFVPDPQVAKHLPLPPAQKILPIDMPIPSTSGKKLRKR